MAMQFSRRAVLAQIGAAGLAAALPATSRAQNAYAHLEGKPWFVLTDDEARFLASMADVFIPEDEFPSASQAGVVDFIDLQLAGPYGRGAGLYLNGPFPDGVAEQGYQLPLTPAELIRRGIARAEGDLGDGLALVDRDTAGRESFIRDVEQSDDTLLGVFFDEAIKLTNWGYFADPMYGGNEGYAGWRMVGFPGAHAYYTSFVDRHNLPFQAPPKGIAHVPGTNRSADFRVRPARGG